MYSFIQGKIKKKQLQAALLTSRFTKGHASSSSIKGLVQRPRLQTSGGLKPVLLIRVSAA